MTVSITVSHKFTNPIADDPTFAGVKPSHWNDTHDVDITGLGEAAEKDVGTDVGNLVEVLTGGKLPALDGSNLTNITTSAFLAGATDPDNGDGSDGDIYLQTGSGSTGVAGDVWKKESGTWGKIGSIAGDSSAVATAIHGASGKTTPVDADEVGIVDSADSNNLKKLTWENLKATLENHFDLIYEPLAGTGGGGGDAGLWIAGDAKATAAGTDAAQSGSHYVYLAAAQPTTSQEARVDSATLAHQAQGAGTAKLRFNYAGTAAGSFARINGALFFYVVVALFRDSETDAIAKAVCAQILTIGTSGGSQTVTIGFNATFVVDVADTDEHIYHMRIMAPTTGTQDGSVSAIHDRIFSVEERV